MNKAWQKLGVAAYWATWPGLWLILRRSRRTRILIRNRNKIVVVKSLLGNGKWGLPGGGIHRSESATTALLREVEEETGLRLIRTNVNLRGQRIYKQDGLSFAYSLYETKISGAKKLRRQKYELVEVAWVAEKELNLKNANYDVLNALKKQKRK